MLECRVITYSITIYYPPEVHGASILIILSYRYIAKVYSERSTSDTIYYSKIYNRSREYGYCICSYVCTAIICDAL